MRKSQAAFGLNHSCLEFVSCKCRRLKQMMLFWLCSSFTKVVLLLYIEFLDEYVEMSSSARTWHQIHGFIQTSQKSSVCAIQSLSVQCLCVSACANPAKDSPPSNAEASAVSVLPDQLYQINFISNQWKDTKIFPFLSASSLVIPCFGCSSPSPGDFLL